MVIRDPAHSAAAVRASRAAPTAHGARAPVATAERAGWTRHVTLTRVLLLLAAVVIAWGYRFPTDRYITPERGFGYALGIVGGSMMLVLLLYPARKRARWLGFIGSVKRWFQAHMLLGVLGPICILFHANFSLGATNSNVALWSMVIVAASGLVGRYFYTKIHHGLHGQRATLADLTGIAARLREKGGELGALPHLLERLEAAETAITQSRAVWLVRPLWSQWQVLCARRTLRRQVQAAVAANVRQHPSLQTHLRHFALAHIDERLRAARRLAELESFERLFSWWHILHLPLFFMLLIAGVVHVVAVHVY